MGRANQEARARLFKLYVTHDGCTWVIARGPIDAWKCLEEHEGESRDRAAGYWREVPATDTLEIWCDPDTECPALPDDATITITRTALEWIKLQGRGWLCTTEEG